MAYKIFTRNLYFARHHNSYGITFHRKIYNIYFPLNYCFTQRTPLQILCKMLRANLPLRPPPDFRFAGAGGLTLRRIEKKNQLAANSRKYIFHGFSKYFQLKIIFSPQNLEQFARNNHKKSSLSQVVLVSKIILKLCSEIDTGGPL